MKWFCSFRTELLKIIISDKEKRYRGLLILFVWGFGLWVFSGLLYFHRTFCLHLCCTFLEKNDAVRKQKLSLLEFYNSKITIQILCSCKSNPFISMA